MGEEQYTVKRWIVYCPYTQRYVNHETSFVRTDEKKDVIATCTGIEDCCSNCFFLLGSQAIKETEKKRSALSIQISKTNKFI
ncbi:MULTISPECIES: hypothetical protein [unclassified Bacillus (in: firmicutes)]|uniref:hypothetical protein n=1 Tax=unclassified Bacillus (in: firmicutes) TaxID=185979 RepID=UPI001BE775FC|nr:MULTISPECIES: hypothetical protein [unclassified Bacillus (in: firmicutes)]MBT2618515.1 hypothetical protein [Bacillus sp. ISL-78]MBT2632472.1 hypothetical protein [Bacillus sp. ISL-101]MBT2719472.1 hypothetical protein [Bacillus sp. ISL-57]